MARVASATVSVNAVRWSVIQAGSEPLVAPLSALDRPALVLWGTDDPNIPVEQAERQRRSFPSARVELLGVGPLGDARGSPSGWLPWWWGSWVSSSPVERRPVASQGYGLARWRRHDKQYGYLIASGRRRWRVMVER